MANQMSAQHSPGPWRYLAEKRFVVDADGFGVAMVVSTNHRNDGAAIAALPQLMALLEETLRPGAYGTGSTLASRIQSAIAAARGQA